jgi:hypothetical protein
VARPVNGLVVYIGYRDGSSFVSLVDAVRSASEIYGPDHSCKQYARLAACCSQSHVGSVHCSARWGLQQRGDLAVARISPGPVAKPPGLACAVSGRTSTYARWKNRWMIMVHNTLWRRQSTRGRGVGGVLRHISFGNQARRLVRPPGREEGDCLVQGNHWTHACDPDLRVALLAAGFIPRLSVPRGGAQEKM